MEQISYLISLNIDYNETYQDLNRTCKEMHKRMVELLEQVVEEGLVCQLLDLIDKLNNTFLRYGLFANVFQFTSTLVYVI